MFYFVVKFVYDMHQQTISENHSIRLISLELDSKERINKSKKQSF